MPNISIPDPFEEPQYIDEPDFSDLAFEVKRPERNDDQEPELTVEERHESGFKGEAYQGPQLGGFESRGAEPVLGEWERPSKHRQHHDLVDRPSSVGNGPGSEICVFSGWPRRHVQIGRHCPHGMLERLREQDVLDAEADDQ